MKSEIYDNEQYMGTAMLFLLKRYTGIDESAVDLEQMDINGFFCGDELLGLPYREELDKRIGIHNLPESVSDVLRLFWEIFEDHEKPVPFQKRTDVVPEEKWAVRSHLAAYMFLHLCWFKVFYRKEYYAAALSVDRNFCMDYEEITGSWRKIERYLEENIDWEYRYGFSEENGDLWRKDEQELLRIALECLDSGFDILPADLNRSDPTVFTIEPEGIRVPFDIHGNLRRIDVEQILARREEKHFASVNELAKFLPQATMEYMKDHHMLEGLEEEGTKVFRRVGEIIRRLDSVSGMLLPEEPVDVKPVKPTGDPEPVPCGFERLDRMLGGFRPGKLYYIGGRPSMGKTAFFLSLAVNISMQQKKPVWYISTEESGELLVYRTYAIADGTAPVNLIQNNFLYELHRTAAEDFNERIRRVPMYICDDHISLGDIEQLIRSEVKGGIVMIDGMDKIQIDEMQGAGDEFLQKKRKYWEELNSRLKRLAEETNVPILVAAKISRQVESRADKHPSEKDIPGLAGGEQYVDGILVLYRDSYYDPSADYKTAEVTVLKSPTEETGTLKLDFHIESGRFREDAALPKRQR